MKRATFIILAALLVIVGVASPVLAQKDPFKPLVSDEGAPQDSTGSGQVPVASPGAPAAPETTTTDGSGLARTGAQADRWVPMALILVLVGVAVLVLDRYRRTA